MVKMFLTEMVKMFNVYFFNLEFPFNNVKYTEYHKRIL